jgi:hypothetical protein
MENTVSQIVIVICGVLIFGMSRDEDFLPVRIFASIAGVAMFGLGVLGLLGVVN